MLKLNPNQLLVLSLTISAIVILTKVFYFSIACASLWHSGVIELLRLLMFPIILLGGFKVIVSITRRRSYHILTYVLATLIPLTTLLWLDQINPEAIDFQLYLKERQEIVRAVETGQLQPAADGTLPASSAGAKKIVVSLDGPTTVVSFWRCYMGFGDGYKAFVYRSDDKDITISNQDYQNLQARGAEAIAEKTGVKETPTYLKIDQLSDRWFWQVISW